jgi:hypothetical protein
MASYTSYKKVDAGSQILSGTVTDAKFNSGALRNYCVLWVYGSITNCSTGCCCLWTVPTGVRRVTFELWGAGGNGSGACSCGRCQHYAGAQGGYYNSKTISVCPTWQYTICAGGVYPCNSIECNACDGCASYVTGCNLSGFCALGGSCGCADGNWNTMCFSDWGKCCFSPGGNGGDFGMGNHRGSYAGSFACHCYRYVSCSTGAPFLGSGGVVQELTECWMRCGCWTVPYASGGQNAMTTYCGSGCCGQGGTGGPGIVRVTYF